MKLRSLLNISNISSTCASDKRLEETSEVKNREFSKLYKLGGELGKGGFGVVYAAVRRADKLQVAVKEVYKAKIIKKTAWEDSIGGGSYATGGRCARCDKDTRLVRICRELFHRDGKICWPGPLRLHQ